MSSFYQRAVKFWFALLLVALVNATIRETTYKPLLTPYIGTWAHQISSLTGILGFYLVIFYFLKAIKEKYSQKDLIKVGVMWMLMTVLFESFINAFIRKLSFEQVLETYYFWKGDTWIFVLLSLVVSPLLANKILIRRKLS